MADQQAAAPAPAATTETAPAPEAAKPPVAKRESSLAAGPAVTAPNPDKPKRGGDRHAEIRAKLAGAKPPETTAAPAADGDGKKPDAAAKTEDGKPKTPETEKPKPAVGAVMRLTAENTKLKGQVEELQTKLTDAGKGETVASLRERVKKDPAVLFDVFGEDIDADDNKRWERLVDSVRGRADPEHAAQRERDERVAKLEKELAEERAGKAELASKERDSRAVAHTAKVLTEGHKADDGTLVIDPTKYPYVNHVTKVGLVDAHAGVMFAVRDMAADFRKEQQRDPSDAEVVTMIGICADEAEKHFADQAKKWQLATPPPAPAPTTETPPVVRTTPTTIGSQFGRRSPGAVDARHLSKAERHEAIRQRLRSSLNAPN